MRQRTSPFVRHAADCSSSHNVVCPQLPIDLNNSLEDRLMKISQARHGGIANVLRILIIVSFIGLLALWFGRPGSKNTGGTTTSAQQTTVPSPTPANAQQSDDAKLREQWQEDIRQVSLPKKG